MARKRNEEYIGEDDDGEFEEEPFESYEDPDDFVDNATDEGENGEPRIQKCGKVFSLCNSSSRRGRSSEKCLLKFEELFYLLLILKFALSRPENQ